MARVTIEDCLKNVPTRFALVHMAATRVRQVNEGAEFVIKPARNGDAVMALREIAAGRVILKKSKKKR